MINNFVGWTSRNDENRYRYYMYRYAFVKNEGIDFSIPVLHRPVKQDLEDLSCSHGRSRTATTERKSNDPITES
jgi:hypothetical protein